MTIRDLRTSTGMKQNEFAEYFNIPVRTLQDWEQKRRNPPKYVIELIEYKIKKEKANMKKEQLQNKIEMMIDKKMLETGKMGTETVSIELKLTDEEKELFHEIELEENYGFSFDGNGLYITYSEEIG